jgi:outer membrane protein assembly factor BamB
MDVIIFCPNCHRFVGQREKCEHCNWVRPTQPSPLGQVKWEAQLSSEDSIPGMSFPVRITQSNGLLLIPTENGDIAALDAETGQVAWQRTIRPDRKLRTNAVAVWRDVILIGTEHLITLPSRDRALLAWQTRTGEEAWNWQTTGDCLSVPLVHQDIAYFASSEPKLYALDLITRQLRWSAPSLTWSSDPPQIGQTSETSQIIVVPSRGPMAAAYSEHGERLWTFQADDPEAGWLNYQPVVTSDTAYLAGSGKQVYVVDLASGQLRCKFQAERGLTCAPVLAGGKILMGVKDYRPSNGDLKPGYGLYALDAASGQVAWQFRTDKHIRISPALSDDMILLGADHRRLHVLDARDGHEVWQTSFPDKLRAGPCVLGEWVIVGQRDGTIVCLQWKAVPPARLHPDELLAQGKPLEAAESLALNGQYEAAARLFAEHNHPQDAAALYLEANLLSQAAEIYVQSQNLDAALSLYRQSGNRWGEADVLALQGKPAEAAPVYEEVGKLDLAAREYIAADRAGYAAQLLRKAGRKQEAAQLYRSLNQDDLASETLVEAGDYKGAAESFQGIGKPEVAAGVLAQGGLLAEAAALNEQLGRLPLAADLYTQAGHIEQAMALYEKLQDWKHVVELAEASSDLPRLANALEQLGQMARAAHVCEQAGQLDRALDLYEALAQWDKAGKIAAELGLWERQARALEQIGLVSQAAEAYQRAAEQLHTRAPEATEELARLYEAAAQCYAENEDARLQQECWDKVCQYRGLPNLRGRFEFSGPFYQDEFNQVNLVVRNVGYNVARRVLIKKVSSKFQLDTSESETTAVTRLTQQQDRTIPLSLQPKPDVLGRVMLRVTLSYQDKTGQEHQEEFAQSVEVLGRDEKIAALGRQPLPGVTPPGGTPARDESLAKEAQEPLLAEMVKLRQVLVDYFDDNELRDLCFELGMDYASLPGEGKAAKARELVTYYERRGQVQKLTEIFRHLRPNVLW